MKKTKVATSTVVAVTELHGANWPGWTWVEPIGWEPKMPDLSGFHESQYTLIDGVLWGEEEEAAGIMAFETDLNYDDEGLCTVQLNNLRWVASGMCEMEILGNVEIARTRN